MQCCRFVSAFAFIFITFSIAVHAQQIPGAAPIPDAGSNWSRVKALPVNTRLHVSTDHGGKSCRVFAVTDDALTCATHSNVAGAVLQRPGIKRIKLTHYLRSSLVGAGIGAGSGAITGGVLGRSKPCPAGQGLCFNGIGVDAGGVAAIFGVGGAVLGSVVGGLTDMARGSAIYTRP